MSSVFQIRFHPIPRKAYQVATPEKSRSFYGHSAGSSFKLTKPCFTNRVAKPKHLLRRRIEQFLQPFHRTYGSAVLQEELHYIVLNRPRIPASTPPGVKNCRAACYSNLLKRTMIPPTHAQSASAANKPELASIHALAVKVRASY